MFERLSSGLVLSHVDDNVLLEFKRREIVFGDPWVVLNADWTTFQGKDSVEGKSCYVVEVSYIGMTWKYYLNASNYSLVMKSFSNDHVRTYFSDYRNVDGYMIPFIRKGFIGSNPEMENTIQKIEINVKLPGAVFDMKSR